MNWSEYIAKQLNEDLSTLKVSDDNNIKPMQTYNWYIIEKDADAVEVGIGKQERASYFLLDKCVYKLVCELKKRIRELNTIYLEPKSIANEDMSGLIEAAADLDIDVQIIDDITDTQRGQTDSYVDTQIPMAAVESVKIEEGSWAIPSTPKKAADLKKLIADLEQGKASKDWRTQLYHLLGDDNMFDELDSIKERGKKDNDDEKTVQRSSARIIKSMYNYMKKKNKKIL